MNMIRLLPQPIEGRHVLYALLAFFGVMLAANGAFLYFAIGTFNGFDTQDAYRTGLHYNDRIAAEHAQLERGWRHKVAYERSAKQLVVTLANASGAPVRGLTAKGGLRRPVTDKADLPVSLTETAPGRYTMPVDLTAGQWVLLLELRDIASPEPYRLKRRLWVEPEQ